ncbi:MAG: biotin attachment protein [Proteobacteria bacterium]|nr:biotin attachment protein [Pseudomonadota bacterium]
MIYASTPKKIRVMFMPFRDGVQSSFGGKVRLKDILPAMEYSAKEAGIRHFEFGGGARYQAPYFYVNEDPFHCMDEMRKAVGPDVDLQILTRSIAGVTLNAQKIKALELQSKLMKKHGTTWDRNFDYLNDVDNLVKTGKPIVAAGMHHQVCMSLMGLPFFSDKVHTAEFYINIVRELLKRDAVFHSVCMKDASGTADPKTCYETAKGLKKILPPEVILWQHTHDTASMGVACYMAGIAGGADGIDLSCHPMASGTCQPEVRSMWHALKGTGYSLDIDHTKMDAIQGILEEGLKEYDFNPVTTSADARVIGFPMPGGAIGPNVHMMKEAGILNKYSAVLAEFPVVVESAGAWTSVTPGSQQYWLQAFNNVLLGRWKKIEAGYGRAVLGYFGRPPLPPDPEVVKIASEQLKLEPFAGDPFDAAPDTIALAEEALKERNIPTTEENIFLVASAIVPGRAMELNEGIRFLTGNAKISLPLKKAAPTPAATPAAPLSAPFTTTCKVVEGPVTRSFEITIEPPGAAAAAPVAAPAPAAPAAPVAPVGRTVPVFSPFEGKVDVVQISVKVGEAVKEGQVVAQVEAMKANHDVKAPCAGTVISIDAAIGAQVSSEKPIMTIGA